MRGGIVIAHGVLDRPRLWRVAAGLSALVLCGLVLLCAQGSLTVMAHGPTAVRQGAGVPSWIRWCTTGRARQDRIRLAFCTRVDGRVIGSTHGPAPGEVHVAVLSDFHLVIVRLPDGARKPAWGAHVVAIGPLFRARDGQREVQAFRLDRA